MVVQQGSKAPAFSLTDKDGKLVNLKDIHSTFVVVYFYPKDNTPGCTLEAQEFSQLNKEFEKKDARVIGISGGSDATKQKFCEKHDLSITLLSDSDFKVSSEYGVYGEKKFMGRTFMGIRRTTFVLDKNKNVIHVFENVKAKGHANAVLEVLA